MTDSGKEEMSIELHPFLEHGRRERGRGRKGGSDLCGGDLKALLDLTEAGRSGSVAAPVYKIVVHPIVGQAKIVIRDHSQMTSAERGRYPNCDVVREVA